MSKDISAYPLVLACFLAFHSFLISSKVLPVAMYIFQGWELHQEGESKDMVIISFKTSSGFSWIESDDRNVVLSSIS